MLDGSETISVSMPRAAIAWRVRGEAVGVFLRG